MHIESLEGLINFLSVIQEADVHDPRMQNYAKQFEEDKKNYNLKPVKENPAEKTEEVEEVEEVEEEEEEDVVGASSKTTPSLDSLIRNINDLRSGESLKRAEIRDEVGEYFDSLSVDEQSVLVLFLKELAAVVTKAKSGSEAQDPSDEPDNIMIKRSDKEEIETKQPEEAKPAQTKPEVNKDIEDDTAPIKVNESQELNSVRMKFKLLQE